MVFPVYARTDVLTYHNDNFRTGANTNEILLTPVNVKANSFGKLFTYSVDGHVYAQPLYVSGLVIPGQGTHNVLFIATEHNSVYAFDADRNTGPGNGVLWQINLGPAAATPNNDFGLRYGAFLSIVPEVGITGTPVIDRGPGTLYVDAFTHEGSNYVHRIHALDITNGLERPFSPVMVAASVGGAGVGGDGSMVTFALKQQLQRSALTLAGGILYVAYAGYDDSDPYHGWIIGFNAATLQPLTNYVFNTTPNATIAAYGANAGEGGIWMAGCGLSVDDATNLFFAVGNGSFNALNDANGTEYGDSFIRLSTVNGLAVSDYFTPFNQEFLADNNLDIGSGGLLLLPDQPGPTPHLMVGGGKQALLYLMNRDQMTTGNKHYDAGGASNAIVQTISLGGAVFHTPAWFNGSLFTCASGDVLAGFSFTNGHVRTDNYQVGSRVFPYPGATPSLSANGASNGIVWVIQRSAPAVLVAYDATNLTNELYNSSQASGERDQLTNGVKFAVPTIANGKVYVGGENEVAIFGLLEGVTPYDRWRRAHFGTNAYVPAVAGDQADPDHDGLLNILEYACASDPNAPGPSKPISGTIASRQYRLQLRRNIGASDLTYSVQRSNAITGPWTNCLTYTMATGWVAGLPGVSVSESAVAGSPPDQFVTSTLLEEGAVTVARAVFYRLLVASE